MAKIELDLPEELLVRLDRAAHRAGETREEFLRRAVEREVVVNEARFREEVEEMLDRHPIDLGGKSAAELIRDDRDHRDEKRFGPGRDGD